MRTKEELLKVQLPKWPQCLISGETISRDQALEIIRRTDNFLCTQPYVRDKDEFPKWIVDTLEIPCEWSYGDLNEFQYSYQLYQEWAKHFGCITLDYLYNDWIYSHFIGGASGWCHPDGTIEYHYNIGKWPSAKEVLQDLETIANEFPFLKFTCTLMDSEFCEDRNPLISYIVSNGSVDVVEPIKIDESILHGSEDDDAVMKSKFLSLLETGYATEISKDVIESWKKFVLTND